MDSKFPALVAPSQISRMTQRNIGIIHMILNRVGVPENLQEFVIAIYASGNWDKTEWDAISLMRMARCVTSNPDDQKKAYNRLRKRSPEFFKWQDGQWFRIIEREKRKDDRKSHKTSVRYKLLIYPEIVRILEMPAESFQKKIREEVERMFAMFPSEPNPPKETLPKEIRYDVEAIDKAIKRLIGKAGSAEQALEEIRKSESFEHLLQLACQTPRL